MAINAKLFGIKPIHNDWEMEDIIEFDLLVSRKKFQAIVRKIEMDETNPDVNAELQIELIDVSKDDDVYINDVLLRSNRAKNHFDHWKVKINLN